MESFQERVAQEKSELDSKIVKLVGFIHSNKISSLPSEDIALLEAQMHSMIGYSKVLRLRLDKWRVKVV